MFVLSDLDVDNNGENDCSFSRMRTLEINICTSRLVVLNCSNNFLKEINGLPHTLRVLDCSANSISKLGNLPIKIIEINCSGNKIKDIKNLPYALEIFDCSENKISKLSFLPRTLKELNCSCNEITELVNLPPELDMLYCFFNQITKIKVPDTVSVLYCNNNRISDIDIPKNLVEFDCSNNMLRKLVNLPFTLEIFEYQNNFITLFEDVEDDYENITENYDTLLPGLPQTKKERFDIRNWPKPPEIHYISTQKWPLIQRIFSEKFRENDVMDVVSDKL